MTNPGNRSRYPDFDKYAAEGNEIVTMLAEELKMPKDNAGRILCAVLHTMREHISIDESMQVIAQLPTALKGLYVEDWEPWHSFHRIHDVRDFINDLRRHHKASDPMDFASDQSALRAIKAVFKTLNYYLPDSGFREILVVLTKEMKEFIFNAVDYGKMTL